MAIQVFALAWWAITFYPFVLIQQHNPYWIDAWHYSSGVGESYLHWAFFDDIGGMVFMTLSLVPAAMLLGAIGALAGKLTARQG